MIRHSREAPDSGSVLNPARWSNILSSSRISTFTANSLFPSPDVPEDIPTTQPSPQPAQPSQPVWQVAKTVIEQAGHPSNPGEIAEMLYGLGFKTLTGRPGRETVRSLLNKKKNIFQKLDGGKFTVKGIFI